MPSNAVQLGDLNIGQDHVFLAGDYVVGSLNINGSPRISTQGGRVRIWFRALNLAGTVTAGSGKPDDLWFFSRPDAYHVNLNGACELLGVVFAPNIPINHSGTRGVYGALVGSSVTLNGNVALHYDEDLGAGCAASGGISLARLGGKAPGPGSTGLLSEQRRLVVAPNPARGRAKAYARLDGAQRAELRILSLSGETVLVVELGAGDGDQVVDLGLDRLASGVYFAVLREDQGVGMAVRATLKLALVR